jgi:hypothetical protein
MKMRSAKDDGSTRSFILQAAPSIGTHRSLVAPFLGPVVARATTCHVTHHKVSVDQVVVISSGREPAEESLTPLTLGPEIRADAWVPASVVS